MVKDRFGKELHAGDKVIIAYDDSLMEVTIDSIDDDSFQPIRIYEHTEAYTLNLSLEGRDCIRVRKNDSSSEGSSVIDTDIVVSARDEINSGKVNPSGLMNIVLSPEEQKVISYALNYTLTHSEKVGRYIEKMLNKE